jgi:hypothetical protein
VARYILRLEFCHCALPTFLAVAALPSLLVRHPCALPSRQMARACALLSACIFLPHSFAVTARRHSCALPLLQMASACALLSARVLPHCRFAVAVRASPLCISVAANGSLSRFAVSLRPLPLRLCHQCLCFAVVANGSCLRFTVSLCSVPLPLCHRCLCVPLVLRRCSKWLALMLCR